MCLFQMHANMKIKDMDKRVKIILAVNITAIITMIYLIVAIKPEEVEVEVEEVEVEVKDTTTSEIIDDMELVLFALIWQESKGNENALNGNAIGILQITPIFVKELNRHGSNYSHSDALSFESSVNMWKTYQTLHNAEKSVKKAIFLHNPKGGDKYHNAVMDKYKFLKYYELNKNY